MSNITTLTDASLSMTSQEIADLVEKRHDNVKRTIESLVNQGVIESPQIEEIPTATRPATVYVFTGERGKRDSIIVVAQLSPEFTARLVDRWQELEAGAPSVDPMRVLADPAAMRSLLLTYTEKVLSLEQAVDTMKPKVNAFERIAVATDGAVCLRVAAKLAQVPEKQYIEFLQQEGWIFRHHHSRTLMGYTDKERAGYLELKRTEVTRDDGSSKTVEQVLITPKGLAKSTELIERKAPWLCKRPVVPQAEMVPA